MSLFKYSRIKAGLYVLLLLLLGCYKVEAQPNIPVNNRTERIINFHSDILIDTTGTITVTEYITVYAARDQIKRGIRRELPLYRTDSEGKSIKTGIKILSVLCNDCETKYHTETDTENLNIYIGDQNVLLVPGIYQYAITYESYGQIGFFDAFDELYWNVTGNGWDFYIEQASASITLPEGALSLETACYTGEYGSSQQECSSLASGNVVSFSTTHDLKLHEGLTVAVSFPRDIVKRPPPPTYAEMLWNKYKRHICAVMGLLLFGCYFFFTWKKVGKDPARPTVIPQFKPPHDWSPATVRYLYKKRYDDKVLTVALINMAVKRAISIDASAAHVKIKNIPKSATYEEKTYVLNAVEEKDTLAPEEKKVYETLFESKKSVRVSSYSNHILFFDASTNLLSCLNRLLKLKEYLHRNSLYAFGGFMLIVLMVILYVNFTNPATPIDYLLTLGFSILLFIIYLIYRYLIKAPTQLGAATQSELEGLKMYLKTAEQKRWDTLMPPDQTPELFEKLLPYAIALDVENEWCKKFDNLLKQANYNPDWYTGSTPFTPVVLGYALANSFNSSIGSAKIDPSAHSSSGGSWSSGSSGGGFSGGGGGGGGGGGW